VGDGAAELMAGLVDSTMESSLLMLALSMWKLNESMATSKPPALAKVNPITHGKRLTTAEFGEPMMISDGDSTVVDGGMSTLIGKAESTSIAGGESMVTGDADELMMIAGGDSMATGDADESMTTGEGAGESVDPDPVVPLVGAN
jgi:hypothetical protein